MATNNTVQKKNQIPSLSMLELTWIENAFPCHNCDTPVTQLWHPHDTIVTHPCHNCDTPMSQLWHTHVTIVTHPCHNCDTPMSQLWHRCVTIVTHLKCHFQFGSILTYLMMEFDFFFFTVLFVDIFFNF